MTSTRLLSLLEAGRWISDGFSIDVLLSNIISPSANFQEFLKSNSFRGNLYKNNFRNEQNWHNFRRN